MLIYVISLGGNKEAGWTILYRIAASCRRQDNVQNLTTDALTFTEERISELIRSICSAELENIFVMDSLMICHNMGADDAQLKFLSGLYELMKVDKNFLTEAMQFVKVLDATFWDNPVNRVKPWKFLAAKDVAPYIGGAPAASFSEAAGLKKNRVVIMNATHTGSSVLLLDDWKPEEILFINCRFEKCGGIYSAKKTVKFAGCAFDQNGFKRYEYRPDYPSISSSENIREYRRTKNEPYERYKELYHFEDAAFADCSFKYFQDMHAFLYLGSGLISGCTFEHIRQYPAYCVLFTVNNAEVSNSQFINCHNTMPSRFNINYTFKGTYSSCMIYSTNARWQAVQFKNCSNTFFATNYTDYSWNIFILLLDKKSCCNGGVFENIESQLRYEVHPSYGRDYTEYRSGTAIIGVHESTAENNEGATVSQVDKIELYDR